MKITGTEIEDRVSILIGILVHIPSSEEVILDKLVKYAENDGVQNRVAWVGDMYLRSCGIPD